MTRPTEIRTDETKIIDALNEVEVRRSRSWEGRREVLSENQRRDDQEQPINSDGNRGNENSQ